MKVFLPIALLFFSGSGKFFLNVDTINITVFAKKKEGTPIKWISHSLQKISGNKSAYYPRMVQLKNGDVIVAYSSAGNIVMHRSLDNGSSWTEAQIIVSTRDSINMDTPDWLQLSNGRILLFYGGRPVNAMSNKPQTGKHFDIQMKSSDDNGNTWSDHRILYRAGIAKENGCWEPSAVQLPSGQVQLFFADESPYTSSDYQQISMLISNDGGVNFSSEPQLISYREGSRDGMPVPQYLSSSKELVLAIEDLVDGNFKPYIIRSSPTGSWKEPVYGGSKFREYAPLEKIDRVVYAGAPYIRQLSDGHTVLSYQSTENRSGNHQLNNARMVVRIGNEYAKEFSSLSYPFDVPENRNALWSSIAVLKQDTVVAITSTNAYSGRNAEVWMIKGVLNQ